MVILSKMEMTREPGLDAAMFSDKLNEFTTLRFIGMVEPAASINDMVFLQDTKSRSIRGGMGKYKNLPSVFGRVSLDNILKPVNLFLINSNFVRCVLGFAENGRCHTDQESLVGNLTNKVRSRLSMSIEEEFEVGFIRVEFINSLKI